MKHLLKPIALLLILVLLLTGCSSEGGKTASDTLPQKGGDTVAAPETPHTEAAPPVETKPADAPETKPDSPATEPVPPVESAEETLEPQPVDSTAETLEPQPVDSTAETLEPQPLSDDLTLYYTGDDWQRINTFLSNFSEVFFLEYDVFSEERDPAEALQDEFNLVNFGYLHLKINDPSKITTEDSYYVISREDMDECLTRFFGHTVPAGTKTKTYSGEYGEFTETVEFQNDAYYFVAGEGESYSQITVVSRVMKNYRENYYVEFSVYSLNEDYLDQGLTAEDYRMSFEDSLMDGRLIFEYSGVAELRDYQNGSYLSYQLVDYSIRPYVG